MNRSTTPVAAISAAIPVQNLWNTEQAAKYCRCRSNLFAVHRSKGSGPVYHTIAGKHLYLKADLDSWLASRRPDPITYAVTAGLVRL